MRPPLYYFLLCDCGSRNVAEDFPLPRPQNRRHQTRKTGSGDSCSSSPDIRHRDKGTTPLRTVQSWNKGSCAPELCIQSHITEQKSGRRRKDTPPANVTATQFLPGHRRRLMDVNAKCGASDEARHHMGSGTAAAVPLSLWMDCAAYSLSLPSDNQASPHRTERPQE
ncbi:uncharacterized protein [Dendrobates tinctorius]|uniref:uncharacterized protein n=1 Tax=Dendrobates tinctorius TaxID=92724 RepID=UPI003CCA6BCC